MLSASSSSVVDCVSIGLVVHSTSPLCCVLQVRPVPPTRGTAVSWLCAVAGKSVVQRQQVAAALLSPDMVFADRSNFSSRRFVWAWQPYLPILACGGKWLYAALHALLSVIVHSRHPTATLTSLLCTCSGDDVRYTLVVNQ